MALLPSAVIEQSTDRVFSYISTKADEKASRGETIGRIEIAVCRLGNVLEETGKIAITSVKLLESWNVLNRKYMEGMDLLNKYKPRQGLDGQVVVRSSSYIHQIAKRAANLTIFSVVGFANEDMSFSAAKTFERYVDWAETKFVADVESRCPLPHHTFRYPFLRHLFDGKTLSFRRKKGQEKSVFFIWPVILEGRGVEALLGYNYFDPKRLDKSFVLALMLRISESTDIVGAAIKCLRSSASLLSPAVAQDAEGELNKLYNFEDISDSYDPPWVGIQEFYAESTEVFRSDPLCCQAANRQKNSVNTIMAPELSQIFPEQTIFLAFECYVPALGQCWSASSSDDAHRNAMVDQRRRPQPLLTRYLFVPHNHLLPPRMPEDDCIIKLTESKKDASEHIYLPGTVTQTQENFDTTIRPNIINHLMEDSELITFEMDWITKNGLVFFEVTKPSPDDIATAYKPSVRPKSRSATKRKR